MIKLHEHRHQRAVLLLITLVLICLLSITLGLLSGNYHIAATEYWSILLGQTDSAAARVVLDLRLPRVLNGFSTGALLALAGVLMQVLLRNPLAEPYVLGISGGASVAVLLCMLGGFTGISIHASAFSGALLSMLLVFALARGTGSWTPTRLLLTGVILASGWGATITLILSAAPEHNLRGMLYWLMGDLSYAQATGYSLPVLLVALLFSFLQARPLNLLSLGHLQAQTLGIAVARLQWQLFVLASILTAVAVMQAGSIGFVGLIIPHLLRLAGLHDHRFLLPGAVLAGGSFLIVADTLSRSLFVNISFPVGVFTALLGVPVFLLLLRRNRVALL